jgi:hypothetical protein
MIYYKKDGYVVDAKETITYSSPIKKIRKTKRKLLLKNTVETSMNDEYTHSMQSPLEGPKYFKKICTKSKKKKRQNILLTNIINETKR